MREDIMRLWTGACSVFVKHSTVDEETGRTIQQEKMIYENIPCHLNFYYYLHHATDGEIAEPYQRSAIFVERDVEIPCGSKIIVTQNGRTTEYSRSGAPVVYSVHREVPVALTSKWA